MVGGDYHEGLMGCGMSVAYGLAQCGFGDTLLSAVEMQPEEGFELFLPGWLHNVCQELRTDAHRTLGRRYKTLASQLTPATFPKFDVLCKYSQPLTSWSQGPITHHIATLPVIWQPREPSIHRITLFCAERFGWSKDSILERFGKNLWEGVCIRMLCTVRALIYCKSTAL